MDEIKYALVDDDGVESEKIIYIVSQISTKYGISFDLYAPQTDDELLSQIQHISNSGYSGIIIDHRLGDRSRISFEGTAIAERLRNEHPSMPIFILTKYIGDEAILRYGFSIDDAIDKSQIIDYPETFIGRLLRSAERYTSIHENEMNEMNELIKKSYSSQLDEDEKNRLLTLKSKLMTSGLIDAAIDRESSSLDVLEGKLDSAIEFLKNIEAREKK